MSNTIKARIEVKKVRTHLADTKFTVAEIKFLFYEGEDVKTNEPVMVGNFFTIFEGDEFDIEAKWIEHPIYGYQLKVITAERSFPRTKKGISVFIQKQCSGVGKVTANRIVDTFGEETLSIIENDWEQLSTIKGVTKKRAEQIYNSLYKHKKFEPISMFILNHGGNYQIALRAYQEFGEQTIRKLRDNPYVIANMESGNFKIADMFANQLGLSETNASRIHSIVLEVMKAFSENRGDLYVEYEELLRYLPLYAEKNGAFGHVSNLKEFQEIAITEIETMVLSNTLLAINENNKRMLYLPFYYHMEEKIVTKVKELMNGVELPLVHKSVVHDWIIHYEKTNNMTFASKQKEAIEMALSGGVSILTGGPGTGKTQTINAIIECLKSVKPYADIRLFAPTGRASKRMTELTGMEAMTIHRGVGIGSKDEGKNVLIESDLVVIDETSMMDVYVCYRLLTSIAKGTSILFVGDVNQLPSVGPGLILRDFIHSDTISTVELNEIFRQAKDSHIIINSHKAIKGLTTNDVGGIQFNHNNGDFYFINRKDVNGVRETVIATVQRFLQKGYELDDIQVLSPMNKGPLGTWSLNKVLQQTFNPKKESTKEVRQEDEISLIREGDRVIHTENNPVLNVFNGELGVVHEIFNDQDRGTIVVVHYDENKEVEYTLDDLEQLNLAYAISTHKSQGSEYPIVITLFHPSLRNASNRNLVYTAWTRAKHTLINIGIEEELNVAIQKTEQINRNSMIKEKLRKAFEKK